MEVQTSSRRREEEKKKKIIFLTTLGYKCRHTVGADPSLRKKKKKKRVEFTTAFSSSSQISCLTGEGC